VAVRDEIGDTVVALLASGQSVVLRGPAGIGKTHLAGIVADRLADSGRALRRVTGGAAQQALGFGALLHLLDVDAPPVGAEFELTQRLRSALVDPDRPTVVLVDDIGFLDAKSAGLIEGVVRNREATLLATERSSLVGTTEEHALSSMLADVAEELDVPPLTEAESIDLLAGWLGPGELGSSHRLAATGRGNPLVLRQLVRAARATGAIAERNGLWYLEGFSASGQSLERLVGEHLARLGAAEWDLVRCIAVAGSLPRSVVRRTDLDALERLELDGLLAGDPTTLTHPFYEEVIRESMAPEQVRRVCAKLVASVGPDDDVDPARLGRWLLDAEQSIDDGIARRGAAVALGRWENELARRLLEHLAEPTIADRVQLVWAHANAGELELATAAADRTVAHASTPAERVEAGLARAELWCLQHHRREAAYAALAELRDGLDDPELIARVEAARALYAQMTGERGLAAASVAAASTIADEAAVSADARLGVLVAGAFNEVFDGRFVAAGPVVAEALELAETLGQRHNRVRVLVAETLRRLYLGDLAGAADLVAEALELADLAGVRPAHVVWLGLASQIAQLDGRLDVAERRAHEAVRAADHVDDFAFGGFVRGDLSALRIELGSGGDLDPASSPIGLARARIRLADPAAADDLAADLAGEAADAGYVLWAPWIAREAIRRGPAPRSTSFVEALTTGVDGPVVSAVARHGRALVDGDVAVLDDVADELDALGLVVPAVDVAVGAAELGVAAGPADSVAARRRVLDVITRLTAFSPHAPPRLSERADALATATSMPSARQLEIAARVAEGRTSKEVAAELVVSVRTVDNHLAAVYRKLGLSGRQELSLLRLPARRHAG
jgi:DNA-binding CsgD family transcriptional regulator